MQMRPAREQDKVGLTTSWEQNEGNGHMGRKRWQGNKKEKQEGAPEGRR